MRSPLEAAIAIISLVLVFSSSTVSANESGEGLFLSLSADRPAPLIVEVNTNLPIEDGPFSVSFDTDGNSAVRAVHVQADWFTKRPTEIRVYERLPDDQRGDLIAEGRFLIKTTSNCGNYNDPIELEQRDFINTFNRKCQNRPSFPEHAPSSMLSVPVNLVAPNGIIVELAGALNNSESLVRRVIVERDTFTD